VGTPKTPLTPRARASRSRFARQAVIVATQCSRVALRIAISRVHNGAAAARLPKPFQQDNGEALPVRLNWLLLLRTPALPVGRKSPISADLANRTKKSYT